MFAGRKTRRLWILITLLPFLLLTWIGWDTVYGNEAVKVNTSTLNELVPGAAYAPWFLSYTGYPANGLYFGAYAIEAIEDTLYLGFGAARSAEADGALLASYAGGITTTALADLDEQGFIDLEVIAPTIYIPGTDPCCGDDWDWGNVYTYTHNQPTSLVKRRNLPNVLHTWKLLKQVSSGALYAVTGSHMITTNVPIEEWIWTGELFRSDDDGLSWNRLANRDGSTVVGMEGAGDSVGNYRAYDIVNFDDKLILTWNDYFLANPPDVDSLTFVCGLAESDDDGESWTRLTDNVTDTIACRQRLFIWADQLLALTEDRSGLRALQTDGSILTYAFPDFKAANFAYNVITDVGIYLYVVGENGRILRTTDLVNWENLEATDREFISIFYWPHQDQIVVADRGDDAKLWQFAPAAATVNSVPLFTPKVDLSLSDDSLQLDWNISPIPSDQYRVYRAVEPYFDYASHTKDLLRTRVESNLLDNNLDGADVVGDVAKNYFYIVRTVDVDGRIGLKSNKVGAFDYPLVMSNP